MAIQQLTTLVTCFSIYHTPHFESFSYFSWSFHAKFERYFFFSWPHWKSRPVCECFLYRIFYVLISPHNIFLPEQNNAIYFRVMASRLPTLLLYSTLPNCQMIFYFFFTAVTKVGRILTLNFRTSSMRGGYFTHFTLLSTHLGIRSIFVGTGMTLLIHKVCSLVERSDTRHCRTSA